jgi:antitoxin (DNA-binding transcriptional repressor) of toxin-antitoxin stability system
MKFRIEYDRPVKTLELRKATGSLAGYVRNAQKEPVIFTVRGNPVAALFPVTNADLETVSLGSNPQFLRLIGRSRSAWKAKGGLSSRVRGRVSRPTRRRFFDLADRLANSTDPSEQKRLKKELAKMTFGD